jgi:predicted aspartyl protease
MVYTFEYDSTYVPALPVVELRIGHAQAEPTLLVRAIVDSGADATIIPVQLLRQVGARKSRQAWMCGFASPRILVDLYAVSIHLGAFEQRSLLVAAGSELKEVILGRDILNHLIVTLNGLGSAVEITG